MASLVRPLFAANASRVSAVLRPLATRGHASSRISSKVQGTFAVSSQSGRPRLGLVKTQIASFHASGRNSILPPEPQVIHGTANDAASVPHASPTHGSYHWTFERLLSVGLVPLTLAPFVAGSVNPATDAILCATLLVHSHIGFSALITDYIPTKRLPKTRIALEWLLRAGTVLVGVGLYEFETNDVGLTEGIRRVWTA